MELEVLSRIINGILKIKKDVTVLPAGQSNTIKAYTDDCIICIYPYGVTIASKREHEDETLFDEILSDHLREKKYFRYKEIDEAIDLILTTE